MVVICISCGRLKRDGDWTDEASPQPGEKRSHGYCPFCASLARVDYVLTQLQTAKITNRSLPFLWVRDAESGEEMSTATGR
ncbi:MAG: hypothetical protein N3A66_08280 [Planctomycetota bacterium]|nr:hypothetical protein [Planctomycetota bacterium]